MEFQLISSHVGAAGEERLRSRVLDCLPSEAKPRTLDDSWTTLQALGESKLVAFCGTGATQIFNKIMEWVGAIRSSNSNDEGNHTNKTQST